MKAIARTIAGPGSPMLADIPIPKPTPNHVILKVLASPINPSDFYFANGGNFGPLAYEPFVCGFEGAGTILEVGEGVPPGVIGKKVTVWPAVAKTPDCIGMWSQFARVPFEACVMLGDHDNCEEYCGLFVNPLTLLAFIDIAKTMKIKAIVHTAAASALGKSLIKVGIKEGVEVICVVRKDEQIKLLQGLGAKYVLNLTHANFVQQLNEVATKLDARLAFDAIAGDFSKILVKAMPCNSKIYSYGILSGSPRKIEDIAEEMKKENKEVIGFTVFSHAIMKEKEAKKNALDYISQDIKNGGPLFKMTIAKKYKLADYKEALVEYKKTATEGKTIFTPNI